MRGFIEFWKSSYGFIKDDENGKSFFVHISSFPAGEQPAKGCIVTFDEGRTSKGPVALNVQIVRGGGK